MGSRLRGNDRGLPPRPPHSHIKRALTAMADVGLLVADHDAAELRQRQPERHLAAQNALLALFTAEAALAGDDEHEGRAIGVRAVQERKQRAMRPRLRHAMQIDPRMNLLAPARQFCLVAAADRRQRRRRSWLVRSLRFWMRCRRYR